MFVTASLLPALLILFLYSSSSHGQSFSTSFKPLTATPTRGTPTFANDNVDFSTITAWPHIRGCLRQQLQLYDGGVANWIGCQNNACLCGEQFAEAENALASDALQECSYVSDMNSATSILSEYCSQKGYVDLQGATSLNTAGIPTLPYSVRPDNDDSGSQDGSHRLDDQAIIGIVFGVLGFFVGIGAVWFGYKTWKVHQRNTAAAQDPEQPTTNLHVTTNDNPSELEFFPANEYMLRQH